MRASRVRLAWVTIGALALFLLVGWATRHGRRGGAVQQAPAPEAGDRPTAPGGAAFTAPLPASRATGEEALDTQAITVDAVVLENRAPCRGEESLVTVGAHAADPGDDPWITFEVNGVPGDHVPLRSYGGAEEQGIPVERSVIVRGRGGVEIELPLPQIAVRDCQRPHELLVSHEVDPLSGGRVAFQAQHIDNDHPEAPAPIAAYVWDFDDGSRVETEAPEVVHDYSDRSQDGVMSSYLIACTARLAGGGEVAGHDAVALVNPLFGAHGGLVAIEGIAGDPRADGRQEVRLRQASGQTVMLTRLVRRRHVWSHLGAEPAATELDPAAVLGTGELGPGGLTITLTAGAGDEVVADEYLVEGTTAGGGTARGRFFVRRPGVPSRLLARLDLPVFRQKLARARSVLGVARVDEEDVFQLEHTHAFDDLGPEFEAP